MAGQRRGCSRCGRKIKKKHSFCAKDGGRAVMLPRPRAQAPAMAGKAAGLAPVFDYRAARADALNRQAAAESDPGVREVYRSMAVDLMKGGAA